MDGDITTSVLLNTSAGASHRQPPRDGNIATVDPQSNLGRAWVPLGRSPVGPTVGSTQSSSWDPRKKTRTCAGPTIPHAAAGADAMLDETNTLVGGEDTRVGRRAARSVGERLIARASRAHQMSTRQPRPRRPPRMARLVPRRRGLPNPDACPFRLPSARRVPDVAGAVSVVHSNQGTRKALLFSPIEWRFSSVSPPSSSSSWLIERPSPSHLCCNRSTT
ncbi:hypothetical protein BHM03_00047705 [Ensete ventricosum]|nr:hypothetical protein BHM03_00047705 [Ensete ventricosum]